MNHDRLADLARSGLVTAAMRRSTMTCGALVKMIGFDAKGAAASPRDRVLDLLSERCIDAGEPSLACSC
ncbi:hypothetical protein [Nocardioides sp. Root151]|uniref:hypothetical protein n=1 Tax=Nocardioides sp. Root151 TaxID=1736475 RepID=UPI0007036F78|nr:hypothetical protein [Nocardioides sp. Root151]